MRICADHWKRMRQGVADRGLEGLVAKSGEAAHESMVRQVEGTATKNDFDPLMNANWAIFSAFLEDAGLAGMVGECCPLCEVEKQQAGLSENWINGALDDQLAAARHLGLVPKVA